MHLTQEKATGKTFAMKILEKAFIQKERKEKYVMIEKEVFQKMHFSPFIVQVRLVLCTHPTHAVCFLFYVETSCVVGRVCVPHACALHNMVRECVWMCTVY